MDNINVYGYLGERAPVQTFVYSFNGVLLQFPPLGIPDIDADFYLSMADFILVEWNSIPGATSYELQRNVSGAGWTTIQDNSNLDYIDNDFNPFAIGLIQYKVRAKAGAVLGDFSAPVGVATPM